MLHHHSYRVYDELKKMNCRIESHFSDLYTPRNDVSIKIVMLYNKISNLSPATIFKSNVDGTLWYDIPFAYYPYWDKKALNN